MPEFLLEVGCEELPATFVEKAVADLAESLGKFFVEAGIESGDVSTYCTPRRLIVSFQGVASKQKDQEKQQRGPSLQAAFDATGAPTKALEGFCRSQGVTVESLRKDEQYVWADKFLEGQPTPTLLAENLAKIILGLNFEKSMRWGHSRARFARPIRWIVAAFDEVSVPFQVESIPASLLSRGHRFYAPQEFEAKNLQSLLSELRLRFVEPDSAIRKDSIVKHSKALTDLDIEISDSLLDENVQLTEWPTPVLGSFPESYLELPEPVLVTAMAKHERMFPIRDKSGRVTNQFIFVRNSGDDETVRRGCEWVLGARFNDARFFYEQDQKHTIEDFLSQTDEILFQAKLGTVRQRASRLAELAGKIAEATGADQAETTFAEEAAKFAKADLASGLVSELSSLQGVIGGAYAERAGLAPAICDAIAHQYDLRLLDATTASGRTAIRLVIADQLDKLAGYLGLGLEPTGSSDPFGLRRAVTILIDCARRWSGPLPSYLTFIDTALAGYHSQGIELSREKALSALADIFIGRYPVVYSFKRDILDAAALSGSHEVLMSPRKVHFRASVLQELVVDPTYVQTAIRPINIASSARSKGIEFGNQPEAKQLNSTEGTELLGLLNAQQESLALAEASENAPEMITTLRGLQGPINAFFDGTMVMSQDNSEREARLALSQKAADQLLLAGDFTKILG